MSKKKYISRKRKADNGINTKEQPMYSVPQRADIFSTETNPNLTNGSIPPPMPINLGEQTGFVPTGEYPLSDIKGSNKFSTPKDAPRGLRNKNFFNENPDDPNTTKLGGENSQGYFDQHPMNLNVDAKNPLQAKNWNSNQGGINTEDIFAGEAAVLSGALPYQKPRDNQKKLVDAYNPFPTGTGSHSTFANGGHISSFKEGQEYDLSKHQIKTLEKLGYKLKY